MPKFCTTCGKPLQFENAEICPSCGVRIKDPQNLRLRENTGFNTREQARINWLKKYIICFKRKAINSLKGQNSKEYMEKALLL